MKKTKNNQIKLSESEMIDHLTTFIQECDSDELARVTGDVFGGKCFWSGDINDINAIYDCVYTFEPDENYAGEFGNFD
jgi:hypothetical protein